MISGANNNILATYGRYEIFVHKVFERDPSCDGIQESEHFRSKLVEIGDHVSNSNFSASKMH